MPPSAVSSNELVALCLAAGSSENWAEFVRRFQPQIALAVLRAAREWGVTSPARIEDFVQDVFVKLCADDYRLLHRFVPREPESIIGYLRLIATNLTRDQLRAEKAKKRGGTAPVVAEIDAIADSHVPTVQSRVEQMDWAIQMREIDDALIASIPEKLTERDRSIFWLYFRQGFSARDISAVASFGLTVKGVESSIHRTTRELRARLGSSASGRALEKGFSGPLPLVKEDA